MRVLQQYERELVGLHRAMLSGNSEGPIAISHRDVLARLYARLGDDDSELCAELSEDLFMIEGKRKEVPLPGDEGRWTADQLMHVAVEAYKVARRTRGNRESLRFVLMLFRATPVVATAPGTLADAARAYMLGRCWEALGFSLAASCFYDFAYNEDRRSNFAIMALDALANAGATTELLSRISDLERSADADPALLLKAATVLLRVAATEPPERQPDAYGRLVRLVEGSIDAPDVLASIRAAALVAEGFAHGHLGDKTAEVRAFSRAVAVKEFDATLVARGLALLPTNPQAAIADFERAIEQDTTLAQPYLYLAHSELLAGNPARVLALAMKGARLATPGPTRARFFEWAAIASAQLQKSEDEVRALFNLASDNDPVNEILRRNIDRFESTISLAREVEWNLDPPDAADARDELERALVSVPLAA